MQIIQCKFNDMLSCLVEISRIFAETDENIFLLGVKHSDGKEQLLATL